MEPLSYALEGRGFLFPDNVELPVDTLSRSRNIVKEWNLNPFCDVDKSICGPSQEITESTGFLESGIADIFKKSAASNPCPGALSGEIGNGSMLELGAMFNHSATKSNNLMSLPIGLKLDELTDYGEVRTSQSSKESSVLSSPESSLPTGKATQTKSLHSQFPISQVCCQKGEESIVYREVKSNQSLKRNSDLSSVNSSLQGKRLRSTNLHSEVPFCQVHGCNKDLSSSKDYHKRHKVCDEHSKTALESIVYREVKSNQSLKRNSDLSSVNSSLQGKRLRSTNLHSEVPFCQVHGCNKDLSSSKDYHKRHKVCDEHSKTALVIVNGIEQRFCQQCSRFHLLAEFDEGKRSCRKRLAGHNERRRKPQFDTPWGSRFLDMTQRRVPFLFPEILPGSFFYQENYEVNNNNKHLKIERKPFCISQLAMSVTSGQSPAESIQHQYGMRKQDLSKVPVGSTILSVQEFSAGQNSSCALSLLSAHSQNLLHNSTGISPTPPWMVKGDDHAYIKDNHHNLAKSPRVIVANSSTPIEQDGVVHVPEIQRDGHDQRANPMNSKNCLSPEGGPTMNLVQLSSHLLRVEQQKNSVQVKQENDIFSSFAST